MAGTCKKLVVVGDADCGKNSLLNVFLKNKVLDEQTPITFDNIIIDMDVDEKEIELSLWSTAGETFEKLARFVWWSCMK